MDNNVAFLIKGGISSNSRTERKPQEDIILSCYNTIIKHIVNTNTLYNFDFYIHSWNYELESYINTLYKPVLSMFEDNTHHEEIISEITGQKPTARYPSRSMKNSNYNQGSQCLSIKKVTKLLESNLDKKKYKYVFYYRPDVILNKDIFLKDYYVDEFIYTNNFSGGDFHWVMNVEDSLKFSEIFEKNTFGWNCHDYVDKFIEKHIGKRIKRDSINPGRLGDQEVFCKSDISFINYALNISK